MTYTSSNNARTQLLAGIGASSLSFICRAGEGDIFPSSFPFVLAFEKYNTSGIVIRREIVIVTNRVGDVFTITRGAEACIQDDTANPRISASTPHSFDADDYVTNYWTSGQVSDLIASALANASTTSKGLVEMATIAEQMARTQNGSTTAPLFINPKDQNIIELTAAANLNAEQLVCEAGTGYAIKPIVRNAPKSQSGTTTGLDSSTTQRMIRTRYIYPGLSVCVYKKEADNKLYATVTSWNETVFQDMQPVVGPEKLLSDDVLEADDGFDFCQGSTYFGEKFVVVYKKASDDKVYGIACTFVASTKVITAGTPTKLYDTNILQSGTRPTCCNLGSGKFAVGIHNDVTDDPMVIPCSVSGTVITPGTALAVEAVTMNAAGQVLVVGLEDGVVGVFYDDGTNISFCPVINDCTSVKTPIDLIAGYVTGSMLAMTDKANEGDSDGGAEVMLFLPYAGYLRILTVSTLYYGNAPYSYFNTSQDEVIYTDTTVLTGYDVCALNYPDKVNKRKCSVGLLTKVDGSNTLRLRSLRRGNRGFQVELDKSITVTTSDARAVCLCNTTSYSYQPQIYMAWVDNGAGNLEHSMYQDNSPRYIGVVETSALSGQPVRIVTAGPAKITGIYGGQVFVGDAGAAALRGTKKAGEGIATDYIIVK